MVAGHFGGLYEETRGDLWAALEDLWWLQGFLRPVEEVMRNGPTTFRHNVPVGKMANRMRERGARTVLVTTSDGRPVGLLYREDAERLAGERP